MKVESKSRAIDKIYRRRDRYEIPEWQRQEVWSRSKKQNLIDSILRGWKLPKFYFVRLSDDPESFEVVDGQQRLTAIWDFFDNDLPLADDTAKEYGGKFLKELPDKVSDAFHDYEIQYDEIRDSTEEQVKGFFQRLQEGLPLTSSEKLNSVHSKLRDYLRKQTKHGFFQKIVASDKRYGHFDILAKVAAIEIDGLDVGLRYDELRALFESQSTFSPSSNVAKRIEAALDFLDKGFERQSPLLRNKTVVQSLLTLVCRLLRGGNGKGMETGLVLFFESFLKELNKQVELGQKATGIDYLAFQRTVNANIKSGAMERQTILLRKLFSERPEFVKMFDPAAIAETSLVSRIREDSTEIATSIKIANDAHASKHGEDLFKMTNKTVAAISSLGKTVKDYDGYKELIEELYFLFYEGPGERMKGREPQTFKDIKILRTDLQHDVDHGKKAKVRKKRVGTGKTFQKYAGETSPSTFAPEKFIIVQANLLESIKKDLLRLR